MESETQPNTSCLNELKSLYPEHLTAKHFSCLRSLVEKDDPHQRVELFQLLQSLLDEYFFIAEKQRTEMLSIVIDSHRQGRLASAGLQFDEIVNNLDLVQSPDSELIRELLECRLPQRAALSTRVA